MVMTDVARQPRSIRVPVMLVRLCAAILVVFLIAAIYGAITYSELMSSASLADDLQRENETLQKYVDRVHSLEKDLATNRLLIEKMMELAGIEASPEFATSDSLPNAVSNGDFEGTGMPSPTQERGLNAADSVDDESLYGIPMMGSLSRGFAPDESEGVRRHLGIDIAAAERTEVFATAAGIVEFAGWDEVFGNYLIIAHAGGYKTYYGHNRALLVSVGDEVRKGELVALSGNTGNSSAPHLHYEIRQDGIPVDPAGYMDVEILRQAE